MNATTYYILTAAVVVTGFALVLLGPGLANSDAVARITMIAGSIIALGGGFLLDGRGYFTSRRKKAGRCTSCGYQLAGLDRCPECGTDGQ